MKASKLIKITTAKQFEKMVELLEKKPELAQSYHKSLHKIDTKGEWGEIAAKLNSLGPPTRTGPEWMKVWADYKCNLKKKLLHNKTECRATGGGINKQYTLTPTEEAASALLQLNSIINPDGEEIGLNRNSAKETECFPDDLDMLNIEEIETPSSSRSFRRKAVKNVPDKNNLIEQQLKVQTDLYNEVKEALRQVERYSRKQHRIHEETLSLYKSEIKIKKEKFEIYKKEFKNKENHKRLLLKLREDEIEIQKRRIEIEEFKHGFNN